MLKNRYYRHIRNKIEVERPVEEFKDLVPEPQPQIQTQTKIQVQVPVQKVTPTLVKEIIKMQNIKVVEPKLPNLITVPVQQPNIALEQLRLIAMQTKQQQFRLLQQQLILQKQQQPLLQNLQGNKFFAQNFQNVGLGQQQNRILFTQPIQKLVMPQLLGIKPRANFH